MATVPKISPRAKAINWLNQHNELLEQPPGSNKDSRDDGISAAQRRLADWLVGGPWCGVWAANGLRAGGVQLWSWRLASVALIEDDAKAKRAPFRDWRQPREHATVLRGDLTVLFGRGVHVGTVVAFTTVNKKLHVVTYEGNTSSGEVGSQSEGGGAHLRVRPLSVVRGFARVDYPGGWTRPAAKAAMMMEARLGAARSVEPDASVPLASDNELVKFLRAEHRVGEANLLREMVALAIY